MKRAILAILAFLSVPASAAVPDNGGPYNVHILEGGIGVERPLGATGLAHAGAPYTLSAWVRAESREGRSVLIALGDPKGECRCLELRGGKPMLRDGRVTLIADMSLAPGRWTHVAAVSDGATARLYIDGKAAGHAAMPSVAVAQRIAIAPPVEGQAHFGGDLVGATAQDTALSAAAIAAAAKARPDFDLVQMWRVGQGWEFQKQANIGLTRQQDPWTLPKGKGGFGRPVAKPIVARPALEPIGEGRWRINGWRLAAAPEIRADGASLSRHGYDASAWYAATVPGTVLTTLVDRGVYPDPYYGLDNLLIPEKLARQDFWYRTRFTIPPDAAGKRLTLEFGGINYASEIWVNGQRLGGTRGAFIRGTFDMVPVDGENVVAVRVMPPPHPGIPHEQSIAAGVGPNGGQLAIDGPTFVDTEGWDWIPGIRDRDTGLWQPVELQAHGDFAILDPQVITDLPLPRTDSADIFITVPIRNFASASRRVTVRAAFDGVAVEKSAIAPPGNSQLRFAPSEFPSLHLLHPRLWWPNGYGDPALHELTLTALDDGAVSDTRTLRFGIREISYDLSLFDSKGRLRRVNVQPTDGRLAGVKLIDVRHQAIKESPHGWAESLTAAGEASSAVVDIPATMPEPHLTIRVNGVRIAARGGSWGMDDAMKRSARERLEPFFRLHREAHLNIIRNWMGTNTEPQFYDLADEYGMMVLNDFWQSTQNAQIEPEDPQLFLANARDAIARYRNHPSIVIWFGRNEGVPYPVLNEGLDDAAFALDGTRWYTGSSNAIDLQGSGPYNYRPPAGYFTDLATGFSVETGTPSLASPESIESYVPKADLWPLSDTLAYHDWHFSGNGDTRTFMEALATMFGAPTSFEDFERKAQMMNLETHKAMYEGFLGHLWTKNSGRLLWMTHPSWPSNAWQIYSWDYDTHAAYYGAKTANEPLHVQLNLPGNELVVLNTTRDDAPGLTIRSRIVSLDNRELFGRTDRVDAPADQATPLAPVPLDRIFAADPMVLVSLEMTDAQGRLVSRNFYWRGRDPASYRALNGLARTPLTLAAAAPVMDGADRLVRVSIGNDSKVPALEARVLLLDSKGERILPAFYSENYISLLPGERRTIEIRYPPTSPTPARIRLDGWNVTKATVPVG